MQSRYATPGDLVEALHQRDEAARPQLWKWVREPIMRLMDEIISQQKLPHGCERVSTHALHTAETFLRTRPVKDFRVMNWSAFRATVLLHVAKQATQPFGAQIGSHLGPTPLPESPLYLSKTVSLPCDRIGGHWYGGDWFAGRHAPDGSLWVIVADITGHGYYAYLLASTLPSVWQACWKDQCFDDLQPADLLAAMHELLRDCLPDGVYVECTLVRLAPDGEATIAPAGGTRMLLRRASSGQSDLLKLRGTWLGLKAPDVADQRTWRLDAGDELLLGTDGAFDQLADQHGTEMTEILSDVSETRTLLDEMQRHLRDALRRVPQRDDITMVLLRRREPAEQAALSTSIGNEADDVLSVIVRRIDRAEKVRLYQLGDRRAGDALVQKFGPLVRSIVQRVLGPGKREDWDDACQAIFLRLFTNLDKWEQKCPFCKWLAVVGARRAIDLSRLANPMLHLPEEEIADPRPAPPDQETIQRIEETVARFPPEWQRIWEWWVQGVRREEMAKRSGKSLRTIQYWLAEMLDQLRERLAE